MTDEQFRQLLARFELSWEGYRRVRRSIKKRLVRHMHSLGFRCLDEYLDALGEDEDLRKQCGLLLTVSISRFFRDRNLWSMLERVIIPEILAEPCKEFRIWSAGCARGEEVYSFKIAWDQLRRKGFLLPPLVSWASDVNPHYLEQAKQAVFSRASLRGLSDEQRLNYFHKLPGTGQFVLIPRLRADINWVCCDLLSSLPPAENIHIILLRNNLLTYYPFARVGEVLAQIAYSLHPKGCLIVGNKEKIPSSMDMIAPDPRCRGIYRGIEAIERTTH